MTTEKEVREAIEKCKTLEIILDGMFWKGEKNHPEKVNLINALRIVNSFADSAQQEIEKRKQFTIYEQEQLLKREKEICNLQSQLAALQQRRFPIQDGPSVLWSIMMPHENQCIANHNQNLEALARRGGLGAGEAWLVVNQLSAPRFGTPQSIWEDYRQKWIEFANSQNAILQQRKAEDCDCYFMGNCHLVTGEGKMPEVECKGVCEHWIEGPMPPEQQGKVGVEEIVKVIDKFAEDYGDNPIMIFSEDTLMIQIGRLEEQCFLL